MYQSQSEERIAREKRKRKWRKNAEQHLSHYKIASIPAAAGAGWQWVVCYKHLIHILRFLDRRKCEAEVFVIDRRGWTRTAKTRLSLTTSSLQRSLYIIWKRRGWWRGREKLGIYRILLPPLPRILPCHRAIASWLGPALVFQRLSTVDYEYTYKVRRNLRALLEMVLTFNLLKQWTTNYRNQDHLLSQLNCLCCISNWQQFQDTCTNAPTWVRRVCTN